MTDEQINDAIALIQRNEATDEWSVTMGPILLEAFQELRASRRAKEKVRSALKTVVGYEPLNGLEPHKISETLADESVKEWFKDE